MPKKSTPNADYKQNHQKQMQQCRLVLNAAVAKIRLYRCLRAVMWICFGLSGITLVGSAILLGMVVFLHTAGLGWYLVGTLGGMVGFGGLGVLTLSAAQASAWEEAAVCLKEHFYGSSAPSGLFGQGSQSLHCLLMAPGHNHIDDDSDDEQQNNGYKHGPTSSGNTH
jgi:hypothetical protein